MPRILQIKEIEKVKSEIQNYFNASEDARFVRRLVVIALVCDGHSINNVAELFGINSTTVQRWIHRLNESGFQSLINIPDRGRRSQLNNDIRLKLKSELEKSPKDLGYDQVRWNGKLLSFHLKVQYGVELKVRQCQNLFKQLGFSLQRPRKMPVDVDLKIQEAFKK